MTGLTDAELDAMENRAAAASAAPWEPFSSATVTQMTRTSFGSAGWMIPNLTCTFITGLGLPRCLFPGRTLSSLLTHDRTFQHWFQRFAASGQPHNGAETPRPRARPSGAPVRRDGG